MLQTRLLPMSTKVLVSIDIGRSLKSPSHCFFFHGPWMKSRCNGSHRRPFFSFFERLTEAQPTDH
jgi:hypothetical protein